MEPINERCIRCHDEPMAWISGPCVGLCRSCIENDHVGSAAKTTTLTAERDALRGRVEEYEANHWAMRERHAQSTRMWDAELKQLRAEVERLRGMLSETETDYLAVFKEMCERGKLIGELVAAVDGWDGNSRWREVAIDPLLTRAKAVVGGGNDE